MRMQRIVDCVVLNYNDADTTIELIEKIKDYKSIDHFIIVDNCSTDDSYERLNALASDRIVVVKACTNGGYGAGNNIGVRYSHEHYHSKYVLISNPDVAFSEECVRLLCSVMDQDTKCVLAAPVQLNPQGDIIPDFAWHLPTAWQTILSAGHYLRKRMWKPYGTDWLAKQRKKQLDSQIVDCVPGALLMVCTDDFCRLDGYDERNFLYWEEAMLAKKIIDIGMHSRLLINETYVHNHSVSINKSIPKAINQIKILLRARYFFLSHYTKASGLQCLFAKVFFQICLLEQKIIYKVKNR